MPRNKGISRKRPKKKGAKSKRNTKQARKQAATASSSSAPIDLDLEEDDDAEFHDSEEDEDAEFHDASDEDDEDYDDFHDAASFHDVVSEEQRRVSIAVAYIDVFDAAPEELWNGVDGTISGIQEHLKIPRGSRDVIVRVLEDVVQCHKLGVEYTPARKAGCGGDNKLILLGSLEEQIVADNMESGLGLTQTTRLVNVYRREEGLLDVGRSAVHSAYLRLEPVVTQILDAKQGSYDVHSAWAKARLMFVLQLLVRLGQMTGLAAWLCALQVLVPSALMPAYFELSIIGALTIYQIAFWDETHKEQQMGGNGNGTRIQVRFKRSADGKLDPNGELAERKTKLKAKYTQETRLSLGCAMVQRDGVDVGLRALAFNYSHQWVILIWEWNAKISAEISRVRALPVDGGPWVVGKRKDGELWEGDTLDRVVKCGPATAAKLAAVGIFTVKDLCATTEERLAGVNVAILRANAACALPGSFPSARVVDHKLADNPYESLYGASWRDEIAKTTNLIGFVCITALITHIVIESAKLFVGTVHEHDWVFYHDALSQLTSQETLDWMKSQTYCGRTYFDLWVKPLAGLNAGTVYAHRPPGNGPELMPWDTSLNKDVDDEVGRHVGICAHLREGDPGYEIRFSRHTPKHQTSAYLRLLDPALGPHEGSPKSVRICQDEHKFIPALVAIRDVGGICVQGLGNRNGHRKAAQAGVAQHGGKRVKNPQEEDQWVHPDAVEARKGLLVATKKRYGSDT